MIEVLTGVLLLAAVLAMAWPLRARSGNDSATPLGE